MRNLLILIIILTFHNARADVNYENGNYTHTFNLQITKDINLPIPIDIT